MELGYQIKAIGASSLDRSGALDLVWRVFSEFEAPDYSDEGVRTFRDFIEPETVRNRMSSGMLLLWGSFNGAKIVGVIAARPLCHIALLFVDRTYHRRGIARALLETVLNHYRASGGAREITVNSSPYAVDAYRRMGFSETGPEQTLDGIRFTPMKYHFR